MDEQVQRITVYGIKAGVTDDNVRKIAVIDGTDKKAKADLNEQVWRAFEKDKTLNKVTLRRSYIPEDQAT